MSPRSEEFMAMARERLQGARAALAAGSPSTAASAAYYSMLYAARAALSEEDRNAKTHKGTWHLFRESFVEAGRFDTDLFDQAQGSQSLREAVDYDARVISSHEGEAFVARAERFVSQVETMLDA